MNNNCTIMLKLYNGDYIIGEKSSEIEEGKTVLDNPRAFVFMPTMGGSMKAGFQPVCFFNKESKKRMSFFNSQIMHIIDSKDIPNEIESGYKTEISGISIASANDVASINSSKNNGDFII